MNRAFVYHNENPYKIEEQDCVCRAISKALDLEYETTTQLLKMSAEVNDCEELCVCCYHYLLEDVFNLPIRYCDEWERVGDIAKMFPNNKVLIRIQGHLTMSDNGVVYDLWNCTERLVDCYWIVPNKN
jgi:hypothetical protein